MSCKSAGESAVVVVVAVGPRVFSFKYKLEARLLEETFFSSFSDHS